MPSGQAAAAASSCVDPHHRGKQRLALKAGYAQSKSGRLWPLAVRLLPGSFPAGMSYMRSFKTAKPLSEVGRSFMSSDRPFWGAEAAARNDLDWDFAACPVCGDQLRIAAGSPNADYAMSLNLTPA